MRIFADVRVCASLIHAGHDVLMAREVLGPRASDEAILAEAVKLEAIVLSHDQDFGGLLAVSGAAKPSWNNLPVTHVDCEALAAAILSVLTAASEPLERGAIATLDDQGLRVHPLPIG